VQNVQIGLGGLNQRLLGAAFGLERT